MSVWLTAAVLAALCTGYAWRALIHARQLRAELSGEVDAFEQGLLEREQNLRLNLANRNVQAVGRIALFGGTGLSIFALTGGREYYIVAGSSFLCGALGWIACGEIKRRLGSLADSWRSEMNRRRRRQGVDQSERTG